MFEYNKEIINRILNIEGFDLNEIDINQIKHVPMHQYRISDKEKSLLLIENLQVCIGLYAYGNNFSFAAHINPVVMRENEFTCDENNNILYSNKINDLFKEIVNSKVTEVNIGLSIGFNPVGKTYEVLDLLDKAIYDTIKKLSIIGINAKRIDLIYNHIFIIDKDNKRIITPNLEKVKKQIKINRIN